jgi:uncharacterized alpha-E superfamily protein
MAKFIELTNRVNRMVLVNVDRIVKIESFSTATGSVLTLCSHENDKPEELGVLQDYETIKKLIVDKSLMI